MKCPNCNEVMIIIELNKVEIDYCSNCSGIWLDRGELELLYSFKNDDYQLQGLFEKAESRSERTLKCPICRKKMIKTRFADTGIIIDKCVENDGLWFDKGELQNILKAKPNSSSEKVLDLLKQIFSFNKSQEAE